MTVALAAHTANHGTGMLLAIGLLVVLSVLTATVVIADLHQPTQPQEEPPMIVHSTRNLGTETCEVRVEWTEAEQTVRDHDLTAFAKGAAAKHNGGYDAVLARVVGYTLDGQDVRPDEDEFVDANGAVVEVELARIGD